MHEEKPQPSLSPSRREEGVLDGLRKQPIQSVSPLRQGFLLANVAVDGVPAAKLLQGNGFSRAVDARGGVAIELRGALEGGTLEELGGEAVAFPRGPLAVQVHAKLLRPLGLLFFCLFVSHDALHRLETVVSGERE